MRGITPARMRTNLFCLLLSANAALLATDVQAWPWDGPADNVIQTDQCKFLHNGVVAQNLAGRLVINSYIRGTLQPISRDLVELLLPDGRTLVLSVKERNNQFFLKRQNNKDFLICR